MAGVLKPLQLLRDVRNATLGDADTRDYDPGLYRTIGNVTFSILPRRKEPHLSKFVLDKSIPTSIARKLADLGPVDSLFTFELYANAAFIPHFTDAASLEEILEVREGWPFNPKHSQILAADVSAPQYSGDRTLTPSDPGRHFQPPPWRFAKKQVRRCRHTASLSPKQVLLSDR